MFPSYSCWVNEEADEHDKIIINEINFSIMIKERLKVFTSCAKLNAFNKPKIRSKLPRCEKVYVMIQGIQGQEKSLLNDKI